MKSGFFLESQAQKITSKPRRTIHIDRKTESLWQEDDALFSGTRRVCYELLKPGETVNIKRYQQQLIDLIRSLLKKRPEYQKRQHKVFFMTMLHHIRQNQFGTRWKHSAGKFSGKKPHAAYSPDLVPSDYHFASMDHALAEQRFDSYEDVKKWLDEWFAAKGKDFYWRGIHKLPERWEKCVTSNGAYFE